jgi:hypothetical protein
MAQFEKVDFPEINRTSIHITDDYSHTAQLSPEQAVDLLQWLYERRDELLNLAHDEHEDERQHIQSTGELKGFLTIKIGLGAKRGPELRSSPSSGPLSSLTSRPADSALLLSAGTLLPPCYNYTLITAALPQRARHGSSTVYSEGERRPILS